MVKETLEHSKAKKESGVSPAMQEGFAAAKVLLEGLRRAGGNPSREKIQTLMIGAGLKTTRRQAWISVI